MKRIIILCLLMFVGFITPVFSDENTTNKTIVESLEDFTVNNQDNTVKLRVLEENTFKNGITFEVDSVILAEVTKVVEPKRGKRNGYLVIVPLGYTLPSKGNEYIKIHDDYWVANVVGYKPIDVKKAAFNGALGAAGYFVKGIGQIFYFGKGIISPNEGEGRLKSGVENVYKNSPLCYIEEGEEINVKSGDILLLKFHYDNVPKWKIRERNR